MEIIYLIFTETFYDEAVKQLGENCGYDINKIKVIRGYPKFDNNGNR